MKFERERAPPPAEKTQTRVSILDIVVYFFCWVKSAAATSTTIYWRS